MCIRDRRYLEQLIDSEQTACLGMLLKYAVEHLVDGKRTIAEVVVQLQKELETSGMRFLAENGIDVYKRQCFTICAGSKPRGCCRSIRDLKYISTVRLPWRQQIFSIRVWKSALMRKQDSWYSRASTRSSFRD